jgi:hypothetical protein
MTIWRGADATSAYEMLYRVIKTHGAPGIAAPPGPDFHQFANRQIANELLSAACFSSMELSFVDCAWDLDRPEDFAEILERGTVRAAMVLSNQPPQNLAAIRAAFAGEVRERFANGKRWRVPVPAALISATA